jgi:hypothetical protein
MPYVELMRLLGGETNVKIFFLPSSQLQGHQWNQGPSLMLDWSHEARAQAVTVGQTLMSPDFLFQWFFSLPSSILIDWVFCCPVKGLWKLTFRFGSWLTEQDLRGNVCAQALLMDLLPACASALSRQKSSSLGSQVNSALCRSVFGSA